MNLQQLEYVLAAIVKRLKKNQLDVGILVSPLNDPAIRETPLFYEPLLVYSSHTYEKRVQPPKSICYFNYCQVLIINMLVRSNWLD